MPRIHRHAERVTCDTIHLRIEPEDHDGRWQIATVHFGHVEIGVLHDDGDMQTIVETSPEHGSADHFRVEDIDQSRRISLALGWLVRRLSQQTEELTR